jgi:hypothetical protein
MQISYLLVFLWIIVIIITFLASANHIFKSGISCLVAGIVVFVYVYLEVQFSNKMTSFKTMSDVIEGWYTGLFTSRFISGEEADRVAQGTCVLCLFTTCYFVILFIMTIFAFGLNPEISYQVTASRIVFSIIHLFAWGFIALFAIAYLAPLFRMNYGFLGPLISAIQWMMG